MAVWRYLTRCSASSIWMVHEWLRRNRGDVDARNFLDGLLVDGEAKASSRQRRLVGDLPVPVPLEPRQVGFAFRAVGPLLGMGD